MICLTCNKNESEHDNTTLCASCDRDEWKDSCIMANKRFQDSEAILQRLHNKAGIMLTHMGHNYPCNYEKLESVIDSIIKQGERQ